MKYLLGIDNGGTLTKAALYTPDGDQVALASSRTHISHSREGFAERDMEDFFQANVKAIRDVLADSAIDPADVAAVAITGHGNGLYLCDDLGRSVHPGIYSDHPPGIT